MCCPPACLPLDQNKQLMPLCRAIEFSRQGEDEEISRRELTVGSQSRNRRRVYLQLLFFNYFCLCVVREYQVRLRLLFLCGRQIRN